MPLSVLKEELIKGDFFTVDRIGNTKLVVVCTTDALKCATKLVDQGTHFYSS